MLLLTDEQKAKIEENRRRAVERFNQRTREFPLPLTGSPISPIPKKPNLNENINFAQPSTSNAIQPTASSNNLMGQQSRPSINPFALNSVQPKTSNNNPVINPFVLPSNPSTSNAIQSKARFDPLQGYKSKIKVDIEVISVSEIQVSLF